MKFVRWMTASVCALSALAPNVWAQDLGEQAKKSPQNILSAVPGDAWAVVVAPSVEQLDQRVSAFAQQLQLPMMGSPIGMAKMMSGIMAGFDDKSGLAVVLLPVENMGAFGHSIVVLLPASDYDALFAAMSPVPADNGMSKIQFMEKESYAAPFGKFAAIAESPDALGKVLGAKTSLRERVDEGRIARFEKDDLTLWVNLKAFTASEMYNGFAMIMKMGGGDPEMFKQFDTGALSLRFDPAGLNIGLHADADPGSEFGRTMSKATATSDPLLKGLPGDSFVIAIGGMTTEDAARNSAEMVDKMLGMMADGQQAEQKAVLETLRGTIASVAGDLREIAVSVAPLADGEDGMATLSVVLTMGGDSKKVTKAVQETLDKVRTALAANPQAAEFLALLSYAPDAEKIAGAPVDHLKVTLPFEADSEDMKKVQTILGKDAGIVRFAIVNDKQVAVSLGGGTARMAKLIEAVKSKKSPLSDDAGIKKVAANVPQKRSSEFYISADRLARMAFAIGKAVGSPPPVNIEIPDINAPIAIVQAPSGKAGSQTEVYLPMELIRTAKDIIMAQMMAPPPQKGRPDGDEKHEGDEKPEGNEKPDSGTP